MASNCCILDSIINWQYSCSEIKSYVIINISIVAPGSQTFTQSNNQFFAFVFVYVCAFVFVYVRAYLVKGSSETVGGPLSLSPSLLSRAEARGCKKYLNSPPSQQEKKRIKETLA